MTCRPHTCRCMKVHRCPTTPMLQLPHGRFRVRVCQPYYPSSPCLLPVPVAISCKAQPAHQMCHLCTGHCPWGPPITFPPPSRNHTTPTLMQACSMFSRSRRQNTHTISIVPGRHKNGRPSAPPSHSPTNIMPVRFQFVSQTCRCALASCRPVSHCKSAKHHTAHALDHATQYIRKDLATQ